MIPNGNEVEVLLGLAGAFRRVPLASLAAVTHVPLPTLRESCSRLLLSFLDRVDESHSNREGEPTEGDVRNVSFGTVRNDPNPERNETIGNVTNVPTDARARSSELKDLTGASLARALDDDASVGFYDQLVARVPSELIHQSLDLTLARRATIRGGLGAYFTAVVQRLAPPPSYARTPPMPPGSPAPPP